MSKAQLKREIKIVRRALFGDDDVDEYGRSKAMLRKSAEYDQRAFQKLTAEEQAIVIRAEGIYRKYKEKAIEWENQPQHVKEQAPFYDEWLSHSKITQHAFLSGVWMTEEEEEICTQGFRLLLRERKKIDPYYLTGPGSMRRKH